MDGGRLEGKRSGPPMRSEGVFSPGVRNCFGNFFLFFFFGRGVVLGLSRLLFGKTQG